MSAKAQRRGELLCLGVSFHSAPVALRERVALAQQQAARFVTALCDAEEVSEAVVISTCNRTEIYLVGADRVAAEGLALTHATPGSGQPSLPS